MLQVRVLPTQLFITRFYGLRRRSQDTIRFWVETPGANPDRLAAIDWVMMEPMN